MIDEIANPRPVLVGETYEGTVVKTTTFGAFVNLVPGRDGLVHISKLGRGKRLQSVEEAVKEGDTLTVLVEDIDAQGKISLKPVGDEWEVPEGTDGTAAADRRARGPWRTWRRRARRTRRWRAERASRVAEAAAATSPAARRFRDQPAGERTDTPPAE